MATASSSTPTGCCAPPARRLRNDGVHPPRARAFAAAAQAALDQAGVSASEITTSSRPRAPDVRSRSRFPARAATSVWPIRPSGTTSDSSGCAAAFPALRAAARICAAQPDAVVLVACGRAVHACTSARQPPEQIVSSSVFADGVGRRHRDRRHRARSAGARSRAVRHGAHERGRGGHGLDDRRRRLRDGAHRPRSRASSGARSAMRSTRSSAARVPDGLGGPPRRAQHPGPGRRRGCELHPTRSTASRAVLRDYGNMSSATVMFILRDMLHDDALGAGATIAGLAFGPGLTVESALLTKRTPRSLPRRIAIDVWQRGVSLAERDVVLPSSWTTPSATPRCSRATLRRFETINRLVSRMGRRLSVAASGRTWRPWTTGARARPRMRRRRCDRPARASGTSATASRWSGSASIPTRARSRWR